MVLWKCCTQYASKIEKLSRGHRTGKCRFSFESQRKAMAKNVQTTAQLHSSHTLVKECSKFSEPGFNSTWTMNFQMFKLDLERAEDQRLNCQNPLDHWKKQESSRKTSISAFLTMPKPLTVWITTNKASGDNGIPVELFQILKDDAVKVLHSIRQQIWKTQQKPQDCKRTGISFQSQRKAMPKNAQTTTQLHSFYMLLK